LNETGVDATKSLTFAIISFGKGEDEVEVVSVDVEAELAEAVEVWFPPFCVTVTVAVFVTVGVVVRASAGDGGFAGEKSDFVTEAMPATMETMPNASPVLSRFLRVMLRSLAGTPGCWTPSFFVSSSFTVAMVLSSQSHLSIATRSRSLVRERLTAMPVHRRSSAKTPRSGTLREQVCRP